MESKQQLPVKISELGDTAFPKISGKTKDFLGRLRGARGAGDLPPILEIEGTVKLHGMHADIVFDLNGLPKDGCPTRVPELRVRFQSRNRVCDPASSIHGWPRNIASLPEALVYLRDRILARYHDKNPNSALDHTFPLIVGGEWIGPKVQPNVGVSELSHRFVILAIQLNGVWQRDSDYDDIEATKAGIYSIFRAGRRTLRLDTADLSPANPTLAAMQAIANQVERDCPFAASFGLRDRRGEGVVWKPGFPAGRACARFWLKTKGPLSAPPAASKGQNIDDVCRAFVTPRRVEQGFEYLLETGAEPSLAALAAFVSWVAHDVLVEEARELDCLQGEDEGEGEGVGVGKDEVFARVKSLARHAFLEQMRRCGVSAAELG